MHGKILLVSICLFCISCQKPPYRNEFIIAGTYLEVVSGDPRAAGIVYEEFRRLDKIFNKYDPESEISRLNSGRSVSAASVELIEVLKMSGEIEDLTSGYFNISCGALYDLWKDFIGRPDIVFPPEHMIEERKKSCCRGCIEIDEQNGKVAINAKNTIIDLGGIAKGYMVDKAADKLKKNGITSVLINAGGDIYCLGRNSDRPWTVGIKNPGRSGGLIDKIDLSDEAVATSGGYEQFFEYRQKRYSHLINPLSGYPKDNDIVSVTVVSSSCAIADALATAICLKGEVHPGDAIFKNSYAKDVFIVKMDNGEEKLYIIGKDTQSKKIIFNSHE